MTTTSTDTQASIYTIYRAKSTPELKGLWEGKAWGQAPSLVVDKFHPASVGRHSVTNAKLLYDDQHVYIIFKVDDQHVQCVYGNYQDSVCKDSCVEFFVKPKSDKGYFNFEVNCGGAMLLYYITGFQRNKQGQFGEHEIVPYSLGGQVKTYHSMSPLTPTPIDKPITWTIELAIPLSLMSHYVGPVSTEPGATWTANFYKCGGDYRYRHWISWSALNEKLDFHQPACFGQLVFGQ